MSEFWTSSMGAVTGLAADAFAKSVKHVPNDTYALASIESFKNEEFQGNKFLNINWLIVSNDFKGWKVSQKLKVFGEDKVRHRALNMLKLIYQLFDIKPSHNGAPTDADLSVFTGKRAGIKIQETEPNENGKQYNWVSEVHPEKDFKCEVGSTLIVTHTKVMNNTEAFESAFSRNPKGLSDDVPF